MGLDPAVASAPRGCAFGKSPWRIYTVHWKSMSRKMTQWSIADTGRPGRRAAGHPHRPHRPGKPNTICRAACKPPWPPFFRTLHFRRRGPLGQVLPDV